MITKKIMLVSLLAVSANTLAHNPEVDRHSICATIGTEKHFLKVDGADFGEPKIGQRYVKIWREQDGVDIFTIDDPLDQGGLNSGLCTCDTGSTPKLSCD